MKRRFNLTFFFMLIILIFTNCNEKQNKTSYDFSTITSYREIPGLTAEEISAIEAIREQGRDLTYGMMLSTESFVNYDGEIRGYSALICEWLSELFGITFIPQNYLFSELLSGLESGVIDFAGFLMDSEDRRDTHFMTHPIAYRTMLYYRLAGSENRTEISTYRLPRYAFIAGAATTSIVLQYATYDFEVFTVNTHQEGYELMQAGEIDAIIAATVQEINFINHPDVIKEFFFPLIYTPVSLSTQNPELRAFISVVQKALESGADRYLNELYRRGYQEYTRQLLYTRFTESERDFIRRNPVIPMAAEFDNYPLSFFDMRTNEWRGIAFDVLKEAEAISGLEFKVINKTNTGLMELRTLLENGEALIISDLYYTPERSAKFLWADEDFLSAAIALVSLAEYPDIGLNEVYSMRVGLAKDSAFASLFTLWFPDHNSIQFYDSQIETFNALMDGEIDIVMCTVASLRWMTNYMEQPGFKANIVFDDQIHHSRLAFNRDADILHSILNKTLNLVDVDAISGHWLRQTYDYRARLLEERSRAQFPWIVGAILLASAILVLISILFIRSRNAGKQLEILVLNRTKELDLNQRMLETALNTANTASRAKSEFLAKMSHEIRTPMNAIIGMAELALRSHELNNAREYMVTVKHAGFNLLSIINDILDFSKIETGKLEITINSYYLMSLLNDVISIIRMRAVDKRIRFVVYIDSKMPNILAGDEVRIRQILLNVLSNAVKFTEKGFVYFTVNAVKTGDNEIKLIFEIKDSGIGIKEEDLKNLFEEYTQFNLDNKRNEEGTGLGLAISNSFAKAMKGSISVSSTYGEGSTFTVTLPQKVNSWKALAAVDNAEEKNILLYERREIYSKSIVSSIENLGLKCTLVINDDEFNQELKSRKFDFIFVSYHLYKDCMDSIAAYHYETETVVLAEFGEVLQDKNLSSLATPVHSISIAEILNGVSAIFSYNEHNDFMARFTSPDSVVLVADDIETNLKVAEGLLSPYMMKVELCKSGREAIKLMKEKHYDLVFMDHKMPDLDGMEATKLYRQWEAENNISVNNAVEFTKQIPIVALTANAVVGTREMFLENGFNDFLSKPIDTVELNTILEKWIPQEKQISNVLQNPVPRFNDQNLNISIEGIDTTSGMNFSGRKIDQYINILEIYYKDSIEKISILKDSLESGDINSYTIHVHALKSASANIGAASLSKQAEALENAGDKNDLLFIENNNSIFISNLQQLLENIKSELIKFNNSSTEITEDYISIKTELKKLKTALSTYNAEEINRITEYLETHKFQGEAKINIDTILENILLGDFEKVIETINAIDTIDK